MGIQKQEGALQTGKLPERAWENRKFLPVRVVARLANRHLYILVFTTSTLSKMKLKKCSSSQLFDNNFCIIIIAMQHFKIVCIMIRNYAKWCNQNILQVLHFYRKEWKKMALFVESRVFSYSQQ